MRFVGEDLAEGVGGVVLLRRCFVLLESVLRLAQEVVHPFLHRFVKAFEHFVADDRVLLPLFTALAYQSAIQGNYLS